MYLELKMSCMYILYMLVSMNATCYFICCQPPKAWTYRQDINSLYYYYYYLPSLKPPVEKMLKSHVVYQIKCSSCDTSYVGQTTRHLTTRLSEHKSRKGPVIEHFLQCKNKIDNDCISVLDKTTNSDSFLLTLEAIWIGISNQRSILKMNLEVENW